MAQQSPKNFEDALEKLEIITQNLQEPMISLEDALEKYQQGIELAKFCQEKLTNVEQAISVLDNNQLKEWDLEND